MNSIHDLEKSTQFKDQAIVNFFFRMLDALFGKHDQIILDNESETPENQKLIQDNWKLVSAFFHVPKRVLNLQKCVRQTLKHIVDHLNSQYQFQQPIQFITKKKTVWEKNVSTSLCYTELNLI
jgi:hypothetical protein